MSGLELFGWAGSALLVYSLLQARVMRFRVLNLIASIALAVFNGLIEVWPMVGMNAVIALIDLYFIYRLWAERHDASAFTVIEVAPNDGYLSHILATHGDDIARFFPNSQWASGDGERSAYVVMKADETVGVVLSREVAPGTAQVDVDYVTLKYRDFSPGEFVYTRSGIFARDGFTTVLTPPNMVGAYYERLGFRVEGDHFRYDLTPT